MVVNDLQVWSLEDYSLSLFGVTSSHFGFRSATRSSRSNSSKGVGI